MKVLKNDPAVEAPNDLQQFVSAEQAEIDAAEAEITRRRTELAEKQTQVREADRQAKISARKEHRDSAKYYRKLASEATDKEDADRFITWAMESEQAAAAIVIEGEAAEPVVTGARHPWFERNHKLVAFLQMVGVLVIIWALGNYFNMFHEYIDEANKHLPFDKQMQPYDVTSIQKFVYEKMVVFADLPIALIMTFLIMPFIGFYVLPFVRSQKDFYTEFYNDLTAWQRACISTAFLLGLLLFLALSHGVKP